MEIKLELEKAIQGCWINQQGTYHLKNKIGKQLKQAVSSILHH